MKIYLLLIATALLWGISPILEKTGLKDTSAFVAVTIRSMAVTVALLGVLLFNEKFRQGLLTLSWRTTALFVASGILAGLLGMWTYFSALKLGAPSKIVPLAATYPMVTAVLSLVVLHEQVSPLRLIGIGLIIAGIWLVRLV